MNIPWDDLRLFLAVAEGGSLSAAARDLSVAQPTVSRRLAELERALGYALFQRSVDGAALTLHGERLLEPARRMAEWAGEVERAAEKGESAPRGVVRIAAPPGIAFDFVARFAAHVQEVLPEIQLQVLAGVHYVDLSRREADLALRMKKPEQRDLICVASLEHAIGAFAAPSYVHTLPRHCTPRDVRWIGWAPPFESLSPNPELAALIPGFRPAFASDDFLVQWSAAEAGVGALFLGRVYHRFSRLNALVELQLDWGRELRSAVHLVCAKSALEVPRVRAVADLLAAELTGAGAGRSRRRVKTLQVK